MSGEISSNIIVDYVFYVGKNSTVAAGLITSGVIHLGNTVEIHSDGRVETATVTHIEISKNGVEQAGPGDYVHLAFDDLDRNAIERGALIVWAEGAQSAERAQPDVVQYSARSSQPRLQNASGYYTDFHKVGKRKAPKHLAMDFFVSVVVLVMGLFITNIALNLSNPVDTNIILFRVGMGLVGLGMVIYFCYTIFTPFYYRWVLSRDNVSTSATILSRWKEEHANRQGGTTTYWYTYHIAFEFNPLEATVSSGKLALKGKVAKKYYNELSSSQTVTVRYSTRDPKIVLLVGE